MTHNENDAVKIKVRSNDPESDPDEEKNYEPEHPIQPPVDMDDSDETNQNEQKMSEEDQILKELLVATVARLTESCSSEAVRIGAVEILSKEIRRATSSMTSVPKPLKFLRPYYDALKSFYRELNGGTLRQAVADVLSVLGMTMAAEGTRECLAFKLEGNKTDLAPWGHEFIRALSGEISQEFMERKTSTPPRETNELIMLVDVIVPFQIEHNSETEAVDLLLDVEELEKLYKYVDKNNFHRVCLYLLRFGEFLIALEDLEAVMGVTFKLYMRVGAYSDALRVAMRINNLALVQEAMAAVKGIGDKPMLYQMALILGANKYFGYTDDDCEANQLVSNESLSARFQDLARELNVEEPKKPGEVYKSHLSETNSLVREATQVQSAQQNLAKIFVNAFVNCGFQKDSGFIRDILMIVPYQQRSSKNQHHIISAAASLGMILLWDVDAGMSQIDKYLYDVESVKAGALLAMGVANCGVRDSVDPTLALLREYVEGSADDNRDIYRLTAALGLGLAYSGNPNQEVADVLMPVTADTSETANIEVVSISALAMGLVFAGTGNEDVCMTIVQRLMEASETELDQPIARLMCVGLGVLFLGKQDNADATIEAVKTLEHRISKFAEVVIESCAYTGSGNVLQVQKLMHLCAEHLDKDGNVASVDGGKEGADNIEITQNNSKVSANAIPISTVQFENDEASELSEDAKKKEKEKIAYNSMHQSAAVIGISLITFGENIGRDMSQRSFQHLLQYGDLAVRRAVPLAMALSHISDPDYTIIDILSKLTHDTDMPTAMSAIFALGLTSSGTNNSRVAQLLRSLASFYAKKANPLFIVRLAQGLLHASKGLVTLAPYHSDRTLMIAPAIAGILTVVYSCLDLNSTLLDKHHYLMFCLTCAIRPRMLMTLDADTMKPIPVKVRVGDAVETVGQAGKPKTISGFQTHSTPVLLSHGDRAELATDDYESLTSVFEGIVLLKKTKDKSIKMDTSN